MLAFQISEDISVVPSLSGWSLVVDGVVRMFRDFASSDDLISSVYVSGRYLTVTESSLIEDYYRVSCAV